ncbi:putative transcriptional regulator [Hyphomonas adhaerens MHS-3]|uniref:Putative transcriptional regulator n=1 Tax=Hyphomonas adhaerens MHS-3 TaxID=1280949 RepID=A0A069E843_9PROT|nr:IclR family transcriptional regulator [Hyphomonas adhaerens]KCZ86149.1 putative transcriptional regulator [Hyphomonas adhaerens MHS-3]
MARMHTTSLEKSLALLREIVADGGNTPFNEVASRIDLPASTAYRLVSQLVEAGFASRYGPNIIGPGLAATLLYGRNDIAALMARLARPLLKKLSSETGLTSHLGVFENGMVTYKVRMPGRPPRAADFTREGMQLEAYCSAVGKVLLAGLNDQALNEYLSEGAFVPLTSQTIVDPVALRTEILSIRKSNVAIDDREVAEDMICLAVPVTGPDGETVAALSVSMPYSAKAPPTPMAFHKPLQRCALALSNLLRSNKRLPEPDGV